MTDHLADDPLLGDKRHVYECELGIAALKYGFDYSRHIIWFEDNTAAVIRRFENWQQLYQKIRDKRTGFVIVASDFCVVRFDLFGGPNSQITSEIRSIMTRSPWLKFEKMPKPVIIGKFAEAIYNSELHGMPYDDCIACAKGVLMSLGLIGGDDGQA